ncbi:MAG: hypothetical protein ACTSRZ_06145 [Promethearchaeota archaeon]
MIIFEIEELEDFMKLLQKRINDEIFFYIKDEKDTQEFPAGSEYEVILHFLGKIDDSRIGLFQTKLTFSRMDPKDKVFSEIKRVFEQNTAIKLVRGRISEGYISF